MAEDGVVVATQVREYARRARARTSAARNMIVRFGSMGPPLLDHHCVGCPTGSLLRGLSLVQADQHTSLPLAGLADGFFKRQVQVAECHLLPSLRLATAHARGAARDVQWYTQSGERDDA